MVRSLVWACWLLSIRVFLDPRLPVCVMCACSLSALLGLLAAMLVSLTERRMVRFEGRLTWCRCTYIAAGALVPVFLSYSFIVFIGCFLIFVYPHDRRELLFTAVVGIRSQIEDY